MPKKLTHEEFLDKFKKQNENSENIEILGEYVNNKTKIKCKCRIDGYEWETTPNHLLSQNQGCPKCYGHIKLTHEEFINKFYKKNRNAKDIEILGKYKNNKTKIKCRCKIDNHIWYVTPNSLLNGYGCPKCGGSMKLTHEEFVDRMEEMNDDIEILEEYKGSKIKIKCKCKIDGYEWYVTPNSLLNGYGCPKCYGHMKLTHEEFINKIKEINKNIEILEGYKGNKIKIKCKCKIDGNIWYAKPNNLLSGYGCPKCSASKGEKRIEKYLDSKNVEYEEQYKFDDCKFKKQLPFDFYIPSLNTIIEYDGEDHYTIFTRNKKETYKQAMDRFIDRKIRDTVKNIYCKENNIKLIRIPYWDFDKIEKILDRELEEFLK